MEVATLVMDIMRVLFLAAVALFVCHMVRLPSIVGLLITGVISGPGGLRLVHSSEMVHYLAEIGIVLLLFTIGVEFSLDRFMRMRRAILIGGGVQVIGTVVAAAVAGMAFGMPANQAIFLGFIVSITSTAILLKVLQERGEADTPHGRIAIAIAIFQDLAVLVMVLLTPLLEGREGNLAAELGVVLLKIGGMIVFVVVAGRYVMPRLLYQIVKTRSRELFMMSIVLLCMTIPLAADHFGFSIALGAFIAGVVISETDYAHHALAGLLPMRDVFAGLFFVSVGMLLDPGALAGHAPMIILGAVVLIGLKTVIATGAVVLLRYPLRTCLMVGVALAQVGEFSFILANAGLKSNLLTPEMFQISIGVAILSMAASPFLFALTPRMVAPVEQIPLLARLKEGGGEILEMTMRPKEHVILIGFGVSGRHLAAVLKGVGVPYVVVEMNAETVTREKEAGQPIMFGDATQEAVLERAGADEASTLVITLPDPLEARRITQMVRSHYPSLAVIARTRFASEVGPLREIGAAGVVADEYEAALELIAGVLRRHGIPRARLDQFIDQVRADGYHFLRTTTGQTISLQDLRSAPGEAELRVVRVAAGAPLAGRTLGELDLRRRFGLTLLTIRRDDGVISNPGADERILAGDEVVLFGQCDGCGDFEALLRDPDVYEPAGA